MHFGSIAPRTRSNGTSFLRSLRPSISTEIDRLAGRLKREPNGHRREREVLAQLISDFNDDLVEVASMESYPGDVVMAVQPLQMPQLLRQPAKMA